MRKSRALLAMAADLDCSGVSSAATSTGPSELFVTTEHGFTTYRVDPETLKARPLFDSMPFARIIFDPWIDVAEAEHEYGLQCLTEAPQPGQYAAVILAVGHQQFMELGEAGLKALGVPNAVVFDVKSILPLGAADGRL